MKAWTASLAPALALTSLFWFTPASAQQQPADELKKDVEALKEAVSALQKDVQEIKALLQSRQPVAPPSQKVRLDVEGRPFKGERTAKLTLVEFSDYQ
jgi:protein-disulfide isomerase